MDFVFEYKIDKKYTHQFKYLEPYKIKFIHTFINPQVFGKKLKTKLRKTSEKNGRKLKLR